jgi:hypothetical protein
MAKVSLIIAHTGSENWQNLVRKSALKMAFFTFPSQKRPKNDVKMRKNDKK